MALPFADASFDAVVCQFGVMFFPDKPKAFAETRRVLRPGGAFLFNAWDRIGENEFTDVVTTPWRCCSRTIRRASCGARRTAITTRGDRTRPAHAAASPHRRRSRPSPRAAWRRQRATRRSRSAKERRCAARSRRAIARRLGEAVDASAAAIAQRFGTGPIDAKIQAHIVTVER